MKISYSDNFLKQVQVLSREIKKTLKKKLTLMLVNPRHPSLRTKKIQGQTDIFESSVTMSIRITWQYTEDGFFLRNIGVHDKTLNNP